MTIREVAGFSLACLGSRVSVQSIKTSNLSILKPELFTLNPRPCEINGTTSESKSLLSSDGSIKITKKASNLRCETPGELRLTLNPISSTLNLRLRTCDFRFAAGSTN